MTFDETEAYNKPDSTEVAYYKNAVENLRKELASLREQLETNRKLREELESELSKEKEYSNALAIKFSDNYEELKQKEDENRELVNCLQETLNEVVKFYIYDGYPDFVIKGQALISRLSAKLGK